MRTAGQYPPRIITGGVDAHTVMQGSKRSWSYDEGGGNAVWQHETVSGATFTPTFKNWVMNRGQGTHAAAFRFSPGDVAFGGVTWKSCWTGASESYGTDGSYTCHYFKPGQWGSQFNDAQPNVEVFRGFAYQGGDHLVHLGGLTVGRSYVMQVVFADNRVGVDGRTAEIAPVSGVTGPSTSPRVRYGYTGDNKYLVLAMRFVASATTVSFRPNIYENNGTYAGTQVNAVHILQDVLPQGKMFYIANDGNDENDGMSRETPWASLDRVQNHHDTKGLGPGDCVLFKRGHKWTGRLQFVANGAPGKPIILSAYSDGAHPLLDGGGYASGSPSGVIHVSGSHWIIDGFEIVNWPTGATYLSNESYRHGILVGSANGQGLVIRNNYVHDILGAQSADGGLAIGASWVPGRHCGGISVWPQYTGNFDDILIENNTVERVLGCGIQIWGPQEYDNNPDPAPGAVNYVLDWDKLLENVVIRGNTVWGCACDNILYQGCLDALVENNHSGFSGMQGRYPNSIAGLWGTRSNGGVQQYNHSHNSMEWAGAVESFDGQGLGIDIWMRGTTTLRYNFTHDNYGGFALDYFAGENTGGFAPAILICHHNISVNEPRFTSGRDQRHYHGVYFSPTDDWQLHWGYTNLTINSNVFEATSMGPNANVIPRTLNNVWFQMGAKPTQDTTGVRTDPLFVARPPRLIYRDEYVSYNSGDPNTPMAAGQLERRWFGTAKLATYNTFGGSSNFWVGRVRALELLNMGGSSALSLDTNLAANVVNEPLTVQLLVRSHGASDATNWLGLLFRDTGFTTQPFVTDGANKFSCLIRRNGECQAFKNGSGQADPMNWANQCGTDFFHIIELVFTNTAGTGSAFTNQGTRVRMYSDGLLLGTYDVDQMSALYFAYNVYGSEWWVRKLHVFAYNRGMGAYKDYTGLIPSGSSPLLNAATPGLVAGATDFFRNALDGSPNRGASEVTTLAAYTQTTTRIEIRGRYRLAKPTSGSVSYNYDAIVRDQNHRVVAQTPTWSIFPATTGVTINAANGIVTVSSTAAAGSRFAVKASHGGVTSSCPVEITA